MVHISTLAVGLFVATVCAVDKTVNPVLNAQLKAATQQIERLALLPSNSDWFFDFTKQEKWDWSNGGSVVNANAATFPAAVGNGMTVAMLNLAPCGMLPAHYHPRASNYVVAIKGNTTTYMFEENGARLVTQVLLPMQMTIFPQASMHMMVNNGCDDAQLVSALNNEDQGTQNILNVFTNGFPADLVNAIAGGNLATPAMASLIAPIGNGANAGSIECQKRCGLGAYAGGYNGSHY